MEDLIKALQIFSKYTDTKFPTHCEHDALYVMVDPSKVSGEDLEALEGLHFSAHDGEIFISSWYGSA